MTHAVRKRPKPGDFRIHERYGGVLEPMTPTDALAELAGRVVATLPAPTVYARVDVVELAGQLHVLEVEVTEPRLYLEFAPPSVAATDRLVAAIRRTAGITRAG